MSLFKPGARKYRTLIIRIALFLWVLSTWYWIQITYLGPRISTSLPSPITNINTDSFTKFLSKKYPKFFNLVPAKSIYDYDEKKSIRYDPGVHSIVYNYFLTNGTETIDDPSDTASLFNTHLYQVLTHLDFDSRCNLYFNSLYANHKSGDPIISPTKHFDFNRDHYKSIDDYLKWCLEQLKKEFPDVEELTVEQDTKFREEYAEIQANLARDNVVLHDYITHLKVFNKCFLASPASQDKFIANQRKLMNEFSKTEHSYIPSTIPEIKISPTYHNEHFLETLIYPWLSQRSPLFETHDGKTYELIPNTQFTKSHSFLQQYKSKLGGRGIVLTIADDHTDNTIRLIHILRHLGNEYPIQIVYDSTTLSAESKFQVFQAATVSFHGLKKQDITFVQVNPTIADGFMGKFGGFGNKILAVLFNSFEEMLFLDADVVILQPPRFFFQLKKYQQYGTLFYKDRSAVEFRPDYDIQFFKNFMNNQLDEIVFGLNQVTNNTIDLPFFSKHINHYMESGLVLIDRRRHFNQALIMAHLNFYLPIQSRLYGDKELFWLSMAMYGDESFQFNNHFAAAIGEVTPDSERILDVGKAQSFMSKEICSNHPAHINDEDNHTLLWFNSGYVFCNQLKKINFEHEFEHKKRYTKIKTLEEFKTFFTSKLIIKAAIVPPHLKLTESNDLGEPDRVWFNMGQYCSGYTWCAYSSIGSAKTPEQKGWLIEYSPKEQEYFNALGDVWMEDFDYRSYAQIEKDEKEGIKKYSIKYSEQDQVQPSAEDKKRAAAKRKEQLLKIQQTVNEKLDEVENPWWKL
ncbi:mannosyltransferase putative-domain-containing protein [Scheffersomyces amazonensis]|uniref:mannosyltransferase putative-domain-containing protein n=1 Tax=Scheffersomyces amazonensis TaxID=1078765 RepID=UPI00315C8B74